MLLIGGAIALIGSFFCIGKGGFWSAALSGALLVVLGLVFLRNTGAAATTLTLIAGTVFLVSGVVRLAVAANEPEYRAAMIFSGVISTALGLIVLLNLFTSSYVLLGILLGVQALADGLTMMLVGRPHQVEALGPGSHSGTRAATR
jgi:uncharacterized membrane protein HdeD (DUF308 family)